MSEKTKPRITVRLTANQLQVLNELKDALGCNIALIVRAIIGDFLTKNEDILESIIEKYQATGESLMNNEIINIEEDE